MKLLLFFAACFGPPPMNLELFSSNWTGLPFLQGEILEIKCPSDTATVYGQQVTTLMCDDQKWRPMNGNYSLESLIMDFICEDGMNLGLGI